MSRIGKAPIPLPDKVSVSLNGLAVTVKGPKGELSRTLPEGVQISQDGNTLVVSPSSETRRSRERHGLCRTLVANMVDFLLIDLALHPLHVWQLNCEPIYFSPELIL